MKSIELKKDLHDWVDRIENEELLQSLLSFLKYNANNEPGRHWNLLNEQQKQEVLDAYEESEDEGNLIRREDFLK